jgi:peroxiredoxin
MIDTMELGPRLNTLAPEFMLYNHENHQITLRDLMGRNGLLLGFTGDIWQPASVRRILWLQRHEPRFARRGVNIALLICDKPHMLYGFYLSTVTPLAFPLLADADRRVHEAFRMDRFSGLVLLDRMGVLRDKWLVPDERVWPREQELIRSFELL